MKRSLILLSLCLLLSQSFAMGLGYAFSGGGARGFAHIGILKVLEEEGIRPEYVSGTSIGAVIGALYAMGYNAAEIESLSINMNWSSLLQDRTRRSDLYIGQKRWAPFGNMVLELDDDWNPRLPTSLYRANSLNLKLFELYSPVSGIRDFQELPIPFACVATNLQTGEAELFQSGSLMRSVRASLSVPSLMLPFEIDSKLYIDGGIAQNLPVEEVRKQGASTVIGFKVNSSLRDANDLISLIDVLDQTINIGMTVRLSQGVDACDMLLEPDLSPYTSQDFRYVREIIKVGELYARDHIEQIREFFQRYEFKPNAPVSKVEFNDRFDVLKLEVEGNERISYAKIREYLGLEIPGYYSSQQIANAAQRALNSQFFNVLYPELYAMGDTGYILKIHVKERQPKTLSLNNAYNDEVKLTASAILSIDNQLLKNSRLLAQVVLGGKNELNLDYVKNFGEFWGIYYRIFSYINEKTRYAYNEDHLQVNSTKSLEWGATTGVGLFSRHNIISEAFLYYNNTSLYRGISESDMPSRFYNVAGMGVKAYYESVDDYSFPSSGVLASVKMNFARDKNVSDFIYSSIQGKVDAHVPLHEKLSLEIGFNAGSYIDSYGNQLFDPYAIGGMDGFKGYSRYAISARHYRNLTFGFSTTVWKHMYLQAGLQGLEYDDDEFIGNKFSDLFCYYVGLGSKVFSFPIKLQFALNDSGSLNTMFSIGKDWDIFHFSRK